MNFGEELKFLGGLYNAIKDKYSQHEIDDIYKEKLQLSVKKNIVSSKTANQIENILFDKKEQNIENLIESIMDDNFSTRVEKNKVNVKKFGDDLIHIGKLFSNIEEENKANSLSEYSINKIFCEKVNLLIDKKIVTPYVANSIIKIIDNKEIDNLIDLVMKESSPTPSRTYSDRSVSVDPCGHSSVGRSPC